MIKPKTFRNFFAIAITACSFSLAGCTDGFDLEDTNITIEVVDESQQESDSEDTGDSTINVDIDVDDDGDSDTDTDTDTDNDDTDDETGQEQNEDSDSDSSDSSDQDNDSDSNSDSSSDDESDDNSDNTEINYSVGELYASHINFDELGGNKQTENYRVIGYYMPSLDGSFPPSEIGEEQANKLTHINFAFIGINANLECDFVAGDDPTSTAATIAELQELKYWNPNLKTLFSIGGWAESNDASATVANYRDAFEPQNIDHLIDSCVNFMEQHGFDGIDIDWEYPRSEDTDNFVTGLAKFRTALDARNKDELLTIAGAGGAFFMSRYYHKLPEIVESLDFINLMTYDLNGPWQGVTKTNFHAHLYGNSEEPKFYNALREAQLGLTWEEITDRFPSPFALTVDAAIKQHLLTDIPRNKIVMGVPFYGRAFFNTGTSNNGLYQSFNTPNGDPYVGDPSLLTGCLPCEERNEPRIATYKEIEDMINGGYGYTVHFDEATKAPWLYHAQDNIFVTYDNAKSMRYKTDYIKQEGLGGVMFWHLGQDSENFTLLNTLHSELNGANAGTINGENNDSSDDSTDDSNSDSDDASDDSTDNSNEDDDSSDEDSEDDNQTESYPEYSADAVYLEGDRVVYNGVVYEAHWYTQGEIPSESGEWGVWREVDGAEPIIEDEEDETGDETDDSANDDTEDNNQDDDNEQDDSSDDSFSLSRADLEAKEAELTDTDLMRLVKASIATLDNDTVEAITPQATNNPDNVKLVEGIISATDWDYIFPERSPEYTYTNFLKAVGKFPAFCGSYDDGRDAEAICRKSLATMFAHFTQETGGHTSWWDVPEWRQGLVHVREMGWDEEMRGGYNGECLPDTWQGQTWPCGTFENGDYKSYFGRGAKQLSYNYNYGPFSQAIYGDVRVLLDNPELVADTWLNLASAVFFFVYPQPPKPSMLHVIDGTWQPNARDIENGLTSGFGVTTQIINGGVECGGSVEVQQSVNRIDYYQNFAIYLGIHIPSNEVLGCIGMKQFDADGAGALNIYWEQDWSWSADTPDGKSYACQLVGYQTPFSAFTEGDYVACVEHFFDVVIED